MELEAEKSFYARDMAERVGLAKWIDYRVGDALQLLAGEAGPFDFVWQITGRGSTRSFDTRSFDTYPARH